MQERNRGSEDLDKVGGWVLRNPSLYFFLRKREGKDAASIQRCGMGRGDIHSINDPSRSVHMVDMDDCKRRLIVDLHRMPYTDIHVHDLKEVSKMTNDQMREKVEAAYDGDKWKQKVRRMPDDQIVAIYYRFLKSGKIK